MKLHFLKFLKKFEENQSSLLSGEAQLELVTNVQYQCFIFGEVIGKLFMTNFRLIFRIEEKYKYWV